MKKYLLSILLPLLFCGMTAFAVTLVPVQQGGTGNNSFTSGYILTGNGSSSISVTNPANWNTAYNWGDHSTQNYLDTDIHTLDDIPDGTTYKLLTAAKDGYLNQDVTNGSSPSFLGLTLNSIGYSFPAADGVNGTFLQTDGAGVLSWQTSSGAGDMTKAVYDTNDNNVVDTATALASNGANCSAGNSPLGVDASGAVEGCFDVWTEAENTAAGYISSADDTVSGTELDALLFGSNGLLKRTAENTFGIITDNSTNWQTAYGWGDHSAQGYYNSLSDMALATGNIYVGNASNNPTATSSIFISDEKVGIGTTTPTYALDVVGSIQTDTAFRGDYWISSTGNSMNIQPTGDTDDFFSFKTIADRPTMKREGGKYIYIQSSNIYDAGISIRDDDIYSGTYGYEKDTHRMALSAKNSPIIMKLNSDYDDYLLFQTTSNVPEMTIVGAADFKINAGGSNNLLLNHSGGNIAIGTTTAAYTLSLETGKSFGLGSTQWNNGDEIDGTKIKDADYGDVVIDAAGDWQVSEADILATARTIAGVSFNGSVNIDIPSTGLSDTAELLYEAELNTFSELQTQIADETLLKAGTLTDTKYCIYDSASTDIVCNSTPITNLTDFDQTAWRLFYSNNLGDVIELSLGTDGQYLKSQGGTSSLTWDTPSGSGDVESVGDCVSGACFDGTSDGGTYLDFYDAEGKTRLIGGNTASPITLTLPTATGTLIYAGGAFHDGFSDFVANEHLDWTGDLGAVNIHTGNYPITDSEVPNDITIDLSTVATTANAGDAAVDFFGAGVDAVTDATTCTDIEGTGLSITTSVLNWSSSGLDWIGNAITNAYIASSTEFLADNDTTYVSSDWTLSDITGYVANEHIDWTSDQGATNIHAGNYTDTNTTYLGGTNLTLADTTFNVDDAFVINSGSEVIGGGSGFTWTFDASAGTDTVITLGDNTLNLSTGILQVGGVAVQTGTDDDIPEVGDFDAFVGGNYCSYDTDANQLNVAAANLTTVGAVELATGAETTTGTDATRAITPDGLAGSSIFGRKTIQAVPIDWTATTTVADGIHYLHIPAELNGMNLVACHALLITAGTTNTTDWQIHNLTDTQDILSTKLSVDSGEKGSDTAATPAVINTSYDDVATNDVLRIDCDAISTTAGKGSVLTLTFALP